MQQQLRAPKTVNAGKFQDPFVTAKGEERAQVALTNPQTLWFNTGTLCNIACTNCYIESSPQNDALVYLTSDEIKPFLAQLKSREWKVREIGFTGGEPFMNPQFLEMLELCLEDGYEVLVLTNAMQPMMRKSIRSGLTPLIQKYRNKLTFRVSLDHFTAEKHNAVRGKGAFERTIEGLEWLNDQGAQIATAGRLLWDETETEARTGLGTLFSRLNLPIDSEKPAQCVLFPEMNETIEVPEITTACWGILNKSPEDVMCASSRMVVKHKGADSPSVITCTLLPYAPEFDLGQTLEQAEKPVRLNHPHCAKFCVLGGASCSA